jgi:hypothetical protein
MGDSMPVLRAGDIPRGLLSHWRRNRRRWRCFGRLSHLAGTARGRKNPDKNVLFELRREWPHVRAGGAVVVDDVDVNNGFRIFVTETVLGVRGRADPP